MDMKKKKKDAFDVALDGAFESAFVGAIEEITEGSSKATSEGVLWDLYKVHWRLKLRVHLR